MKQHHLRIFFILSFFISILLLTCSFQKRDFEPGFVEVEVEGNDLQDAERNAKLEMIRQVLGTEVVSHSYLLDSVFLGNMIESSEVGLVRRFRILKKEHSKNRIFVKASGIVDETRLGESIEEQYKLLGKPRILLLASEKFGNEKESKFKTLLETKLISRYPAFDFVSVSPEEFKKWNIHLKDPKETETNPFLEFARKNGVELIWFADFVSKEGDLLAQGTELRSIFAYLDFKLLETASGKILVSGNLQGGKPAIHLRYGSEKALDQLLSEMKPSLLRQLAEKWKRGNTIRLTFENLSYDEYSKSELAHWIRNVRGVNSLNERGHDSQGRMVIEVVALLNGGKLFTILKQMEDRLGFSFESQEIQSHFLILRIKK
ncbi:hypothetical protein JWG45_17785 [Leptospira sp. 201903070]|uniref:Lipoprotein n=1 Tax=Leptospira ainlahdjerensis TaxID=2810033 RepID=A0ABS2UF42_9LEPT|nr:hypothetical protein [Leptospira ainlahdjerensis]MBM9579001.1 hypothetical protein [Leptospira ainlahdjerensis]